MSTINLYYFVVLLVLIQLSLSFAFSPHYWSQLVTTSLSSTNSKVNSALSTIRPAENADFDKIANLLANNMYDVDIAQMQKRELTRIAKNDLDERYSERLGKRTFPSALIVSEVGDEIVG